MPIITCASVCNAMQYAQCTYLYCTYCTYVSLCYKWAKRCSVNIRSIYLILCYVMMAERLT